MKRFFVMFFMFFLLTMFTSTVLFSQEPLQIGEYVFEKVEIPHPYAANRGIVWEHIFEWPNAGYICVHFSEFDLAPGDYVEIFSPDEKFKYTYRGRGKVVRGGEATISEFWAAHIPGDIAIVRLYSRNPKGGWGFVIDKWARGYSLEEIKTIMGGDVIIQGVCGDDNRKNAKCYSGTIYQKSKAVLALLTNGTRFCTGFLIGNEGHIMTNNHCIDSQTKADNTNYEFMAEGTTCATDCRSYGTCPGTIKASSGTLIKTNFYLDYSLIKLPTNVSGTYGYLQFRDTLPIICEKAYIPSHTNGWGKQLTVEEDSTISGYCEILGFGKSIFREAPGVKYQADVWGGSSGAPVIAFKDHSVVALNHAGSENQYSCEPGWGVKIPSIILDLGSALPSDAIFRLEAPSSLTANAITDTQINLRWKDNSEYEDGFIIQRKKAGGTFSPIKTVGRNVISHQDKNVSGDITYYYRVRAYNNVNENSAWSNTASETTPPKAPTNLNANAISSSEIKITWRDNSKFEQGFKIKWKRDGFSWQNKTVGAGVTSWTHTGLKAKTKYCYKIRAYNSYGNSNWSNTDCDTTREAPPVAPSNLRATAPECFEIKLTWQDNSDNEQGFKIYRKSGPNWYQISTVAHNITKFWDTELPCSQTFSYKVRAYHNIFGSSSYSNIASAKTISCYYCRGGLNLKIIPDKKIVNSGELVTYTYKVKNNGEKDLKNIKIKDEKFGDISIEFTLENGKSKTFIKTASLTETYTNFAEATAIYYKDRNKIKRVKAHACATVEVKK